MRRIIVAMVVALCMCTTAGTLSAEEAAWLDRVDAVRAPADSFKFEVAAVSPDGAELEMTVRVRDRTMSLVRYTSPTKWTGRTLLFVDRNMWVYIPGSRRALRISPQQQVLGGVSSADVARVVYSADYAVAEVTQLAEDGPEPRHRLRLEASGTGAAYARIDVEVVGQDARPLKSVFYSASERQLKTAHFEDYQEVLGRQRPLTLRVVDHLDGDAETLLHFRNYEIVDTPATWFQPSYLKRLRE